MTASSAASAAFRALSTASLAGVSMKLPDCQFNVFSLPGPEGAYGALVWMTSARQHLITSA
jgi:hypothetical protein